MNQCETDLIRNLMELDDLASKVVIGTASQGEKVKLYRYIHCLLEMEMKLTKETFDIQVKEQAL